MLADMFGTAVRVAVSIEIFLIRTYFLANMFDTTLLFGRINGKMFETELGAGRYVWYGCNSGCIN